MCTPAIFSRFTVQYSKKYLLVALACYPATQWNSISKISATLFKTEA